jgi:hypothetical protein
MLANTIIEPFRIKSVEPIRSTSREQREDLLCAAHYNLCLLPADDVLISLVLGANRQRLVISPSDSCSLSRPGSSTNLHICNCEETYGRRTETLR